MKAAVIATVLVACSGAATGAPRVPAGPAAAAPPVEVSVESLLGRTPEEGTVILRLSVGATTIQQTETYATAVNVATTDFTSIPYRIEGQSPTGSCVIKTMLTRDDSREEMPPIGSNEVDDAGVAAVTAWINELPKP